MTLSDVKTGDLFALRGGRNIASKIIEAVTDGEYCHVGIFFWKDEELFIAEMYNSYREISLKDRLAEGGSSTPCWGAAPEILRLQPEKVTAEMDAFRADAREHSYDYLTLLRVWASDKFGMEFNSEETGVVCSVYAQRIWGEVLDGFFQVLWSPNDIVKLCSEVVCLPITATTSGGSAT